MGLCYLLDAMVDTKHVASRIKWLNGDRFGSRVKYFFFLFDARLLRFGCRKPHKMMAMLCLPRVRADVVHEDRGTAVAELTRGGGSSSQFNASNNTQQMPEEAWLIPPTPRKNISGGTESQANPSSKSTRRSLTDMGRTMQLQYEWLVYRQA